MKPLGALEEEHGSSLASLENLQEFDGQACVGIFAGKNVQSACM